MIRNLIDAVEFFRGKKVTVSGWCVHCKSICVNGKCVALPTTSEELERVAECIE